MANKKPLLTISLLISNRPDTVRKCLDSICPILNAIPSELILTDTSKNPQIHSICLEYTDKVYTFEWVKDFSKARNFGLEKATGEWFMFLDDDEWFLDVQDIIDFFQSGEYKEYGYADYLTRNFYDTECTQYGDCWVTRMFRRDEDIRYIGKVHEIFSPIRGKKKYLNSTTHHVGYIFLTEEKRQQHSDRNITLLLEELKADPANIRWQTQLVLEYRFKADWETLAEFCKQCLEHINKQPITGKNHDLGTFYAGLIEAYFYLNKYDESIQVCEQAIGDTRSTELAKAIYHLDLAENYALLDKWEKAQKSAEIYLEEYEVLHRNTKLLREQETALLVRYAFEMRNIQKAQAILACCYLQAGNIAVLKEYYNRIKWNLNYTVFYEKMMKVMVDAMATLEYDSIFVQIITDACKHEDFKILACAKAQEWEKREDRAFQRLVSIFGQVEDEFWYFRYMKMMKDDIGAGKYNMMQQAGKPILTISMLISNRPDTIQRSLDSLHQIRKVVPTELILIDTSKNPQIHDILLEYTDQVYEFEWCHDFAKARNEGLKRAKGEWFLFLDDDEWFVDVIELIEFFRSGEYRDYGRATYLVRNFYDPDYVQYADCWVSRMNRIDADSRFVGKVHEYMEPCRGKEKNLHAMAYHSGYVFSTEEERRKHAERNIVLLLEALKDEPDNIRWQTQLAQEYRSAMDWEKLVAYCRKYVENLQEKGNVANVEGALTKPSDDIIRLQEGTFFAGLAEGLIHLGQYQECIAICEEILVQNKVNPLLRAFIYICLAESYFELEDWEKASEYAETYLKEESVLNQEEALSYEQRLVLIVQHTFDPSNIKKAYSILICHDLKNGNTKLLRECYDKLEWNQTVNYVFEKLPSYLIETMPALEYEPIFSQIIADTFQREDFKVFMCREALKWEDDEERFPKLAYIFAQAESDFWFIWYMKIVDAGCRQDVALIKTMAEDDWETNVRSFVSQANEKQLRNIEAISRNLLLPEDWKLRCLDNIIIEKQVMDGPMDLGNLENYYEVLKIYSEMEPILQSTAQAAGKICEYIKLEPQDKLQAITKLKEAVDVCPDFAEGIGRFIGSYSDFEKQRARKQREEMQKLKIQVMEQVKSMVANAQYDAAMQIIGQLKQMFPGDLEVVALGLEVRLKIME